MSLNPRPGKPRSQRVRITARDRDALDLVARLRAVALDDLSILLGGLAGRSRVTVRASRMVVSRWHALGLAQTVANPRGGNAVVVATRDAWEWALGQVPTSIGPPAWRDMPHTLSVSAVAVNLVSTARGCRWISEDELRQQALSHCPDGALELADGRTFAIEVERVQKAAYRWKEIIGAHLARWDGVAYYCHGSTTSALTRWVEANLPTADRARVVICDLGGLAR